MRTKIIHNLVVPFAICFLVALALYPDTTLDPQKYSTEGLELDFNISSDVAMVEPVAEQKEEVVFTPYLGKSFEGFKEALAFKESQGNYFTVNTFGYLGKYQFGKETLKMIGVYNPNQFLANPELQEKAFIAYSQRNKWILRKDISRFVGKTIAGIEVTESGMLAAAHLAGAGSVKKFLRSYGENNFADGFGTTVSYYMKRFSGYNTSFIEADRKAKVSI
ncbi:peptidoglycan-binding protein LysM [Winogradskyella immobilis]|uniref:Peptidoglycan-binding protein LysM n=1 Tax=Winogradskyella immobilis TaxID=2816852 RepID=A0ABS8ENH1_9FLAO|nr:peptidoglycan-binding protein LysM [Winogradskyella immobilis]MCC1484779.1 peptidoglycan-binding protein LysM [Winogradskyella immobilis]MCG0016871.1 peptidoglycan-binding protein LysM [Winogradskyella immobilis]